MKITTLGVDLAKNIFQIHGVDENGKAVLRRKLSRSKLVEFISALPPCLIGVEACGSSHYWVRQFKKYGHTVKSIPPQYVKPFVKTNKNDANDAEAICEAVQRPSMHFVSEKSITQQDIQCMHRIRQRLIGVRTALSNEIRGLLSEYGIIMPKGIKNLKTKLPEIIEIENELTILGRGMFSELYLEFLDIEKRVEYFTDKIEQVFKASEACQRLAKIEGVGPLTATAAIATISDPRAFKNGRQCAAWVGLVPRQNSSGGKTTLLGISKRGDNYFRCLLIHGGRAVVKTAKNKTDKRSLWIAEKEKTRGKNKAAVAVANKNARIIWKMLMTGEEYRTA